jgi:hypothetical protein
MDRPWQARLKALAAAASPAPTAHAADRDHEGKSAQGVNGTKESFDAKTKRARNAIMIDDRVLVRDCLMYCLQAKFVRHVVFSFATLSDWIKVEDDLPAPLSSSSAIRAVKKQCMVRPGVARDLDFCRAQFA